MEILKLAEILLFNPPHPEGKGFTREGRCTQEAGIWATQWPPVTLASTAAFLEADGHKLKVLDCPAVGMHHHELENLIANFPPGFAFWNTATPTLRNDLDLAYRIKNVAPKVITGVMGTHVTVNPDVALRNGSIDMVIRREPEETISEICRFEGCDWHNVAGISYRDPKSQMIRQNQDRDLISPQNIPAPAWHHLDLSPYRLPLKGRNFLIVAPVRGCPWGCNFCTAPLYYGRKLRKRPISDVMDEISSGMARFGIRDFFVWADTFTADPGYVTDFSRELLNRGLKISWTCNSRVDTVSPKILAEMKRAGLWMISFGLESGNNEILEKSGKKITVDQSRRAVAMAHATGIRTSGHFILGLPGETEQTLQETLNLALEMPLDIAQFYAAAPFPGTGLYKEAKKSGWIMKDGFFSQSAAVMNLPGLSKKRVDEFRRYAHRRFYGRPKALRNILSMMETGSVKHMLKGLGEFIGNRF